MTDHTYKVQTCVVEDLFERSAAFVVPRFQRSYAWGPEEVEALIDDLYGDDHTWQDAASDHYFLGSLVLARVYDGYQILDGQQRLTTITLLLSVLRHGLERLGYQDASLIEQYLQAGRVGEARRPKIELQQQDMQHYRRLLRDPGTATAPDLRRIPLGRATNRISEAVHAIVRNRGDRSTEKDVLEQMLRRLLYGVEFVRIEAPNEALAYRLFETLNDRGLPLNAADLIKNKLFAQAGTYLEAVQEAWDTLTETIPDGEILNFLRYYWIASYRSVRKDQLYDAFGTQLRSASPHDVLLLAQGLAETAAKYQFIAEPGRDGAPWEPDTVEALQRLVYLRARSCRPALLACLRHSPDDFPWLAHACESASVRHTLVGARNPNQLDKAYAAICKELRSRDARLHAVVLEELNKWVPDDEQFTLDFAALNVSTTGAAWRVVLMRLNEILGTGETRVEGPSKVHIEHVLPRHPSRAALNEARLEAEAAEDLAASIGNLTLLSGRKNQAISNRAFTKKQEMLASSEIALNKYFAQEERWGATEIEQRADYLARLACEAWPWDTMDDAGFPDTGRRKRRSVRPRAASPKRGTDAPAPQHTPQASQSVEPMPHLDPNAKIEGTVWIPRLLWAMEWARHNGCGPLSAAGLARVLTEAAGLPVPGTNTARAFREIPHGLQRTLWNKSPAGYEITEAGRERLRSVAPDTATSSEAPRGPAKAQPANAKKKATATS